MGFEPTDFRIWLNMAYTPFRPRCNCNGQFDALRSLLKPVLWSEKNKCRNKSLVCCDVLSTSKELSGVYITAYKVPGRSFSSETKSRCVNECGDYKRILTT